MEEKKYLSVSEAAAYMGVCVATMRFWDKKGRIVPERTAGGHRRYKKEALDKYKELNATVSYGQLYEHLCSVEYIAYELGDDIAEQIVEIRERVGNKLLGIHDQRWKTGFYEKRGEGITYFISGHRDITEEEFKEHYITAIEEAHARYPWARFVVGDYQGVDIMAQEFLKRYLLGPSGVTVYHMFEKPRNLASDEFCLSGGYKSDEERDAAMTRASQYDIAWVRPGKEDSGTAQNITRRKRFEKEEG